VGDAREAYDVQLQLSSLGKPGGQWLEVNHLDGACGEHLTPAMAEAEAWLAVEGGASWIGWFLPEGDHGGYETFDASATITDAVRTVDAEFKGLAPVLRAPRLDVTTPWGNGQPTGSGSHPVKVGARSHGGRSYLFATNSTVAPVEWTRAFPGLAANAVVRREGGGGGQRAGRGQGGVVTDAFGPLETRICSWASDDAGPAGPAVAAPKPAVSVAVELRGGTPELRSGTAAAGKSTFLVWNRTARRRTLAFSAPGASARPWRSRPERTGASRSPSCAARTDSRTRSGAAGRFGFA
jgi:hypothetical protein